LKTKKNAFFLFLCSSFGVFCWEEGGSRGCLSKQPSENVEGKGGHSKRREVGCQPNMSGDRGLVVVSLLFCNMSHDTGEPSLTGTLRVVSLTRTFVFDGALFPVCVGFPYVIGFV